MKKCLAVLLSLLLFSCEQDEKFLVDSNCIVQDSHFVDIAYAEAIASIGDGFYLPKSEELISKSTDDHEVESVISLDDIFGTPALYIINLRGGGFRIISADNRLEPILAHSDTGRMTEESINKNGGLQMWINGIISSVTEMRQTAEQQTEDVRVLWESLNPVNVQSEWNELATSSNMDCSYDGQDIAKVRTYGPYLNTKWHQGDDYNKFLENMNCSTTNNGKPYLGCTTLAAGIAMRFMERPTYFDWDSMPVDRVTDVTAHFLADLADNIGVDYGCNGTSASIDDVCDALKNDYGFSSAKVAGFSGFTIIGEIANKRSPVIVRGENSDGGHEWVITGIISTERYKCVKIPYMENEYQLINTGPSSVSFFVDWGHGGANNAWYSQSGFLYPNDLKMIINIIRE